MRRAARAIAAAADAYGSIALTGPTPLGEWLPWRFIGLPGARVEWGHFGGFNPCSFRWRCGMLECGDPLSRPRMPTTSGSFTVKITPQAPEPGVGDESIGRMGLHKVFDGGLRGEALGQRLAMR